MAAPRPVITLYGRPGCSLCDHALDLLQTLAPRFAFDVDVVNIEQDDALHARYLVEIPVIAYGERELARAPIRAAALEDALTEALGR